MKLLMIVSVILFATSGVFGQNSDEKSGSLDEVVVKATYSAEMKEEKLPVVMPMDFSDLIQIPEKISWAAVGVSGQSVGENKWDSFTFKLISPAFANIQPQPVKVFHASFSDLKYWEMHIFRSNGDVFYTVSGDGNPPADIPWDGIGNSGEMLVPGHNYSFSFTAVDRAGNKKTFPGQTFTIVAAFFADSSGTQIRIANSELFDSRGSSLSRNVEKYIQEIALLRNLYSTSGRVSMQSQHSLAAHFFDRLRALFSEKDVSPVSLLAAAGNEGCVAIFIE